MNKVSRSGFTFIELLFVIVILGIVGGIALEAIRQYFDGIYRTQVYTQRVAEADLILDKLSKYFENAIDLSIVNMDQDAADGALVGHCEGDPKEEAENIAHDYTVALIGVDSDSLHTVSGNPGWSEEAVVTGATLAFPDSNLTAADATITALYPASDLANSAIYSYEGYVGSCSDFNWDSSGGLAAYLTITGVSGNTLSITNHSGQPILPDRKYLLKSGYAFRVLNTGEFIMFYNFRPWKGEIYSNGQRSTLGTNVASFYADFNNTNSFNDRGSIWRLKVCMRGLDTNLTTNDIAADAICRERRVHVRY
ncbi:type II secretion system protein [Sulfuricurvum sp.]|uniref:type II secretion system protein n=1 Tax=Sulfuricurvum sp. TaxID=2025608 RepID=UPI00261E875B|nr:type II secretion system protein [Sulfuricurvum sp.]MDD3597866.1 type II secretion system protein [Sulfuricurvum sp.]